MKLDTYTIVRNDSYAIETSMTYKISGGKIQGIVDGLDAVGQALNKQLNTQAMEYIVYSFEYGTDLGSLIGKDKEYVESEIKRRLTECIMSDDRVTSVEKISIEAGRDSMLVELDVSTIFGSVIIEKEVSI